MRLTEQHLSSHLEKDPSKHINEAVGGWKAIPIAGCPDPGAGAGSQPLHKKYDKHVEVSWRESSIL